MGGGGSREEEARNPPPGNSSARQRSEALLSLGDRGRPSAAPARPGEARGESGGRRPAPRPPAAAESPGPAGAGRGGAWERPAGGGGLGARRRAAPDRPAARCGSRRACEARCLGPGSPERIHSPRFLRCVSVLLSALAERAQRPRAGGEPGSPRAPSLPATSGHPARRWLGVGGSLRRAAGGRRGRRGRARVCGAREGRRKEGRAQRPAAGAGVRPAGRGGGAPPVRS